MAWLDFVAGGLFLGVPLGMVLGLHVRIRKLEQYVAAERLKQARAWGPGLFDRPKRGLD